MTAILAGILIGIGDVVLLSSGNKFIGALLFSVALLSIINLKLPLYTGRIGKVVKNRNMMECLKILLFNTVGVGIVTLAFDFLRPNGEGINLMLGAAEVKFDKSYLQLFLAGVFCNILIHIAVTLKNTYITILCIMTFILCGFEHSVADVMFLLVTGDFISWLLVLVGNTVGGIFTECLLGDFDANK